MIAFISITICNVKYAIIGGDGMEIFIGIGFVILSFALVFVARFIRLSNTY